MNKHSKLNYKVLFKFLFSLTTGSLLVFLIFLSAAYAAPDGIDEYSQCANEDGDGYATGDIGCRWTNGNINSTNSTYHEDDATVQRLAIDNLTTGDHTVIIKYGTTKGGKHAYDFMTDDTFSEDWVTALDLCDPALTNLPGCSGLTPQVSGLIPTDINAGGFDVARADRHFKIRNGTWVRSGILSGPTLVDGSYAADSDTSIILQFHVDSSTCVGAHASKCEVLITWGAHISTQADWGTGNSAVNIPGSPYHVQIADVDGTGITGGGRDNQMQASAVVVVVTQAPVVTTSIHDTSHSVATSVLAGTTVHDSVTVTGSAGTPAGDVTFDWFTNGVCEGTPTTTSGTFTLSGGSVDADTFTQGPLNTGGYSFKAHYAGDSNFTPADSTCEPLTVTKVSPQISTTPSAGGVVGGTISDSADVTGGFNPTGTVTFNLYDVPDPTCSSTPVFTDTQTLSGGAATSANYTTTSVGTYHWTATYNGDGNNNPAVSDCHDEAVTTTPAFPTISTEIHDSLEAPVTEVNLGETVHDSATVTGGFNPTGTVDFTFYTSGDCTTGGAAAGTVPLAGGIAHPSDSQGSLAAGFYSFKARYNGDANNNTADSACEPLTVNKNQLTVSTNIHDPAENVVTSVPLGATVHDEASVLGEVSGFSLPNVEFTFYNNGTCEGTGSPSGTLGVVSGVAHPSDDQGPLAAGSYSFKAAISENDNYLGDDSDCELLTVNRADTTVVTEVHNDTHTDVTNGSVSLGTQIHDNATVETQVNGFIIGGNVTYHFYTDGSCLGTPTDETVPVGTESSLQTLGAGSYSYKADYSGDDNYNGSQGVCEPVTINKAPLTVTTQVHDGNHNDVITGGTLTLGTIVHDTAHVSGEVSGFALPEANFTLTDNFTGSCSSGSPVANNGTEAGDAKSADSSILSVGAYAYRAAVPENENYLGAESDCEPFNIAKAIPAVVTELHNNDESVITSEASTDTIHDKATVSGIGAAGFEPSGNVDFTFFTNGTCTLPGASAGSVSLDGNDPGTSHPSSSQGPLAAGSYSFMAHYAGDNNYETADSSCEPFTLTTLTVNKVLNPTTDTGLFNLQVDGSDKATDVGNGGTTGVVIVTAGNHAVSETAGTGTDLSHYSSIISADCDTLGQVILAAGEAKTCAITNSRKGHIIIDKVTDPANDTQIFNFDATGGDYADFSLTDQDTPNDQELAPGSYSVDETVPAGWVKTDVTCNDLQDPASLTLTAGETITCTFTNTKEGSINIIKDASPNDLSDFNFNGTLGIFTLDDDTGVFGADDVNANNKLFEHLLPGSYLFEETLPNSFWTLEEITCKDLGTGDPLSFTTTGAGVTVDLLAGKNVECTFLNTKPSPTRTQGFWQTHTNFTSEVFQTVLASPMPIGISPHKGLITTPKQLFGAYYSSIPKKSDGTKRSPLDQARMQLLQQLVTAKLNCAAFGCAASALSLITTADTNYAGTDKAAILASASALDTFNNSGDTIIISPPLPSPGKATPTDSKNLAAGAGIQFWDTP